MFKPKPTKSEIDRKEPCIYHVVNNNNDYSEKIYNEGKLRIVSIDPALRNFCIRIEDRFLGENLKIQMLGYERIDLMPNDEYLKNNYCEVYNNLNNFIYKYEKFWLESDFILIEHQLPKNINSTRIMQHTISLFMTALRNSPYMPIIIEVDPKLKNRYLDAPRNLNERGYKQYTVQKVIEILEKRNDEDSLKIIKKSKKKDDLADTVAMIEAVSCMHKWN